MSAADGFGTFFQVTVTHFVLTLRRVGVTDTSMLLSTHTHTQHKNNDARTLSPTQCGVLTSPIVCITAQTLGRSMHN